MKSKMLLDKLMRLENIVEAKIYRINDSHSNQINAIDQNGYNNFLKEMYENHLKANKVNFIFL